MTTNYFILRIVLVIKGVKFSKNLILQSASLTEVSKMKILWKKSPKYLKSYPFTSVKQIRSN